MAGWGTLAEWEWLLRLCYSIVIGVESVSPILSPPPPLFSEQVAPRALLLNGVKVLELATVVAGAINTLDHRCAVTAP